jgi:hypothetical protein
LIQAGIDEAGYGPLLGPLVASLVAFRAPAPTDLWEALGAAVLREPAADDDARIPVADSKVLLRGGRNGHGFATLETTALAFSSFATGFDPPANAREFLERHRCGGALGLEDCPWYAGALERLELPLRASTERVRGAAVRLTTAAGDAGVVPIVIAVRPMIEHDYNRRCDRSGSKARVLFDANVELLEHLASTPKTSPCRTRVLCDRHGGRLHYAELLQRAFPLQPLRVRTERKPSSRYTLGSGADAVDIEYAIGAESLALEVALASIFAKYVRELFVELINRWFVARVPHLVRTAGYYMDGARFVEDLEREGALSAAERVLLVRVR